MCVFTAPLFSAFCALATYLFMKEVGALLFFYFCFLFGRGQGGTERRGQRPRGLAAATVRPARPPSCPAPNRRPPTLLLTTLPSGAQVRGQGAGLASAAIIAVVPSYISRSVAGSYDLEAVAIFALVLVFYLYIKVCEGWVGVLHPCRAVCAPAVLSCN